MIWLFFIRYIKKCVHKVIQMGVVLGGNAPQSSSGAFGLCEQYFIWCKSKSFRLGLNRQKWMLTDQDPGSQLHLSF